MADPAEVGEHLNQCGDALLCWRVLRA